jgi:putative tryptophan/tyrosine transport system substrate-binding protein
MWTERTYLLYR